jgi:hypothetical protein
LIEQAWGTPAMNRDVPFTPAPKLGGGDGEEPTPILELVPDLGPPGKHDPLEATGAPQAEMGELPVSAEATPPAEE